MPLFVTKCYLYLAVNQIPLLLLRVAGVNTARVGSLFYVSIKCNTGEKHLSVYQELLLEMH